MTLGSRGVGGRRYQVAAAMLTYAAVSIAAVPMSLVQFSKQHAPVEQSRSDHAVPGPDPAGISAPDSETPAAEGESRPKPKMSVAGALGTLALIGLASPVMGLQDPVRGLIGLVILVVGIRIAWRMTAGPRLRILGPFSAPFPAAGFASASGPPPAAG